MKKVLALLMVAVLAIVAMTGCSKKAEPAKTGLSVVTSLGKSTPATADAEGLAQVDSFVVAVLVGNDGKILDCQIDAAQTKINFSVEGKLTTDVASVIKSKQELGTEYGMKAASAIGKEWNEQADAFAKYVVGKTVDEVNGIAVTEDGLAGDADLAASISVHIGSFISGVASAVANAQDLGAKEGDALGLGVATSISRSADATADEAGVAEAYSYYTASTFDKDGKITSSFIDASQGSVNFDTTGAITSDITVAPQTKQEIKDGYGMKAASSIGKEWYEQANAFAEYAKGKTSEELNGIALTEGVPSDADLAASVTVHVSSFQDVIARAYANSAK